MSIVGSLREKKSKMSEFKFEDLNVYQKTLDIIDKVYELTKKFPKEEVLDWPLNLKEPSYLLHLILVKDLVIQIRILIDILKYQQAH